jgi:hypothetical protein
MREFEKSKSLVGPEMLVRGNVPPEAACLAESLGFCEKMPDTPQGFFDPRAILEVGHDTIPFDDVSIFFLLFAVVPDNDCYFCPDSVCLSKNTMQSTRKASRNSDGSASVTQIWGKLGRIVGIE